MTQAQATRSSSKTEEAPQEQQVKDLRNEELAEETESLLDEIDKVLDEDICTTSAIILIDDSEEFADVIKETEEYKKGLEEWELVKRSLDYGGCGTCHQDPTCALHGVVCHPDE